MLIDKEKVKNAAKVFGPIGVVSGFISDVITPLSPVLNWVTLGLLSVTILTGLLSLLKRGGINFIPIQKYLPQLIILTIVFGLFSLLGFKSENGFFGDNFESISNLQKSVFKIEKGVERIENKVDAIQEGITEIKDIVKVDISEIDKRLIEIESKISGGILISNPSNLEEYLINCMISYNTGNFKDTEIMFEKIFNDGYFKYDLIYKYYEVLLNNYNGDVDRIEILINQKNYSKDNIMFKLAELEHNENGVEYYIKLNRMLVQDTILKSFMENIKIKSFYIDVQKYGVDMNDLIGYWTPIFLKNDKVLGSRIINSKRFFFDYSSTWKRYVSNTSYSNDENTVHSFYKSTITNQKTSTKVWSRISSSK
jgi:hypothetical protein